MTTIVVGLFVKVPEPGTVKTRLGTDVGMKEAASFYAGCVAWLIERLRTSEFVPVVFHAPPSGTDELNDLYSTLSSVTLVPQEGENLGRRMYNALDYLNENFGEEDKTVLIGSDTPLLPFEYLHDAGGALETNDLVLGPSSDGGYYLVGTNNPLKKLFFDMEWSHDGVLEETLDRAEKQSLSVKTLPEYNDIDTLDDLLGKVSP